MSWHLQFRYLGFYLLAEQNGPGKAGEVYYKSTPHGRCGLPLLVVGFFARSGDML